MTHAYKVVYHMQEGQVEATEISATDKKDAYKKAKEKQYKTVGNWPVICIEIARMSKVTSKTIAGNGESVMVLTQKRNLGHGEQVKVIYSDNSTGWEHPEDLID